MFPRLSLNQPSLFTHTAEQELEDSLFTQKEIRVYIKRDDLIHPFISGNKWRKLKYILRDVGLSGKTHLLTFGGAYSNHLLATACLAAMSGLKSTGIVRGEEAADLNDTLFLCRSFGMELIFVTREAYSNKEQLARLYQHTDSYLIAEGGSSPQAIQGCAEITAEFTRPYTQVVLACGTATTAAGIARGIAEAGLNCRVETIVVLKGAEYLEQELRALPENSDLNMQFHYDFHEGGYAKTSRELLEWMYAFISSTGILLDPVYTAKSLRALYTLAEKDYFKPGSSILFIHTGGTLGLLGYRKAGVK